MIGDMPILFFKQKTAYEMRISDWSADVCSSDLVCQPGAPNVATPRLPPHPAQTFRRGPDGGRGLRHRPQGDRPPGARDHRGAAGRGRDRRGDRKSVVEGTSASVRVDLGGRRIIKKTRTKTPNRETTRKQE